VFGCCHRVSVGGSRARIGNEIPPRRDRVAAMRKPAARTKSLAVASVGIGGCWMAFKILCLRF
jgi:hypothetical protein